MKEAKMVDITTGVKRIELQRWPSFRASVSGLDPTHENIIIQGSATGFL